MVKKQVTESQPFDKQTLVYKVSDKMFALLSLSRLSISLKVDPEIIEELREKYEEVTPGYHMNKQHWNTIELSGKLPLSQIYSWIDDSYKLVVKNMSKKKQMELLND